MSWTDERVDLLKSMWNDGKSASQIAKELGGVTRNAVIGKVHRLGLTNRAGDGPGEAAPGPAAADTALPGGFAEPAAAPGPADAHRSDTPEAGPAEPEDDETDASEAAPTAPGVQPTVPGRPRPAAGQPLPPQPANAEMSEETLANLAEVAKKAKRLTLMQLTERTCKWPVGDPATDDFWFCGLPAAPGKPYCDTHVSVAFQPMSSRRDRRSSGGR
jgi:GcrA cell cycle regulator